MNKNKCKIRDKFYKEPLQDKLKIKLIQNKMLEPDININSNNDELFSFYPFLNRCVYSNKILKQQSYYILIYHAHHFQSNRYIRILLNKNESTNYFHFIKFEMESSNNNLPLNKVTEYLKTNKNLYNLIYQGIIESEQEYPVLFFQYRSQDINDHLKINYICEQDLINNKYYNYQFDPSVLDFFHKFPTMFDIYYNGIFQKKPTIYYISNNVLFSTYFYSVFRNTQICLNKDYSKNNPRRVVSFFNSSIISNNNENILNYDLLLTNDKIYTINQKLLYVTILV